MGAYIQSKPTSIFARRIWYLYEEFTDQRLDLPNVTQGNYVDLLNPRNYYTGPFLRSPRQRVNVNLTREEAGENGGGSVKRPV